MQSSSRDQSGTYERTAREVRRKQRSEVPIFIPDCMEKHRPSETAHRYKPMEVSVFKKTNPHASMEALSDLSEG